MTDQPQAPEPQPSQPQAASAAYIAPPPAPAPAPASKPGKVMGIVAFILAFLMPIIGLILGIVAVVQSRKAGVKNGLGVAAIILGALFTIFWTIAIIAITMSLASLGGTAIDAVDACMAGAESVQIAGQTVLCSDILE